MKEQNEDYLYTTRIGIITILVLLFMVFMGGVKENEPELIRPIYKVEEVQAEEPVLTQEEQIENYIRFKFGEHADKAFLLLKGRGVGSCAENRYLDPIAVNDNTTWGGLGRDCGIFQINDFYHPYSCEEMKDWKANIDYAFRMFENDNYTFSRWTCGKEIK